MRLWIGFDVDEAFHLVCVLDEERAILSRGVENTERDL